MKPFLTLVVLLLGSAVLPAAALAADCNGNSIPDDVEIAHGQAEDCNGNGIPDECDVDSGTSGDCNANGIPDECDTRIEFVEETIDEGFFVAATGVDLDGDGDLDAVASLWEGDGDLIVWYENLGSGDYGPRRVVGMTDEQSSPGRVTFGDLDGDGDNDVLHGSENGHPYIGWHENLDGLGTFGPLRTIENLPGTGGIGSLVAVDLDGDDDLDVVAGYQHNHGGQEDALVHYENLDGEGTFGPRQLVVYLVSPTRGTAVDVDGDEDLDLVWAFLGGGIKWFENLDGAGGFGAPIDIAGGSGEFAGSADLDGDGDADVLASLSGSVGWLENLDGNGTFGALTTFHSGSAFDLAAVDLDHDDDPEVLWAAFFSEAPPGLAWHENTDGAGSFGPEQMVSDLASSVFPFDADGDLDQDLLIAVPGAGGVALFRNTSNDCNTNGVPDSCDLESGSSEDCNTSFVPDECESGCEIDCDLDFDGCLNDLDCDPENGAVWSDPGTAGSLVLDLDSGIVTLSWQAPSDLGGTQVVYDTLRSGSSSDFHGPATCIEQDGVDRLTEDFDAVDTDQAYYYLIRVENDCPGGVGSMGADSSGAPRTGLACP